MSSVPEPTKHFRQGMTHRPLQVKAYRASGRVNFTTEFSSITFKMVNGSTIITGSATGDALGILTYQWAANDLNVAGTYAGYFIATDGAARKETFPDDGTELEIIVDPAL